MGGLGSGGLTMRGYWQRGGAVAAGCATAICGLLGPGPGLAEDVALGRYLAAECVACHPRDNRTSGIPAIVGWPPDQFVAALRSYKTRERANPVMQNVAASLTEEQMAALAAYFAALKPGG